MAASSRTIKNPAYTPRRMGVVAAVAIAVAIAVALVAFGQLAMSRSASTELTSAPAAPAVMYSHGNGGDGVGSDVAKPASGIHSNAGRTLLRAELPVVLHTTQSHGDGRSLLRAELPTGDDGVQAPVSPRSMPTR